MCVVAWYTTVISLEISNIEDVIDLHNTSWVRKKVKKRNAVQLGERSAMISLIILILIYSYGYDNFVFLGKTVVKV